MSFAVDAAAYDRFMGRYSSRLADVFCGFAGVVAGQRALDVGCGPGALVGALVERLGPHAVAAVDPSPSFVAAASERYPGVDVRTGAAETLPFAADTFDVACAQLVVHFMSDPRAGIAEMARVTRPDGVVAACVWDFEHARAPISAFWTAAERVLGDTSGEDDLLGAREGQLVRLFEDAGLDGIEGSSVSIEVEHTTFDEWWEPFTLGVGPAGAFAATLGGSELASVRAACLEDLGEGPFTVPATAWAARGRPVKESLEPRR